MNVAQPGTKRKKPFASTQASLKLLRGRGCSVGVVEKWNPHVRIRQDLFGFVDLVAVLPDGTPFFVQTTTSQGKLAERLAKIRDIVTKPGNEPLLAAVRAGRVVIHSWGLRNDHTRGARKLRTCVEEIVTLAD